MAETCYRHPDRETGVSCSSCGRPICPDCMTPTPVGMRCPECMRQRTKVVRNPTGTPGQVSAFPATIALIVINVIVYIVEIATGPGGLNNPGVSFVDHYGLVGFFVAEGEWYRLLTGGFLHAEICAHRLQHVHPLLPRSFGRADGRNQALSLPLLCLAVRRCLRSARPQRPLRPNPRCVRGDLRRGGGRPS